MTTTTDLLVLQATPFCNINCSYCYLPDRNNHEVISKEVVSRVIRRIIEDGLLGPTLEVLWHAGEPLSVPIEKYRYLIREIDRLTHGKTKITYSFQTNGTLINQEWCDFFRSINAQVGISIDGPELIHNSNRVTRNGKGTFTQVMRGIETIKTNEIPFYALCVLTRKSIEKAEEMFNFFQTLNCDGVCFNVEEIECSNLTSSLKYGNAFLETEKFFLKYFSLFENSGASHWVREYDHTIRRLFSQTVINAMVRPFEIISVDYKGNYSTFSPELLNCQLKNGEHCTLGNVLHEDVSFRDALSKCTWANDIYRGVERCKRTCKYFDICGGGSPSSKLSENGTFDSTESIYCRLGLQAPVNAAAIYLKKTISAAQLPISPKN